MLKRVMSSKPTRMWIDGKTYYIKRKQNKFTKKRIHTASGDSISSSNLHEDGRASTVEIETAQEENCFENQDSFDIVPKDGKFCTSFRLPSYYYIKLKQLPPSILQNLSTNTRTDIVYPRNGSEGEVSITGEEQARVSKARTEFHDIIGGIRNELRALQFIGIPILSNEVRENFEKFKSEVLALEGTSGIEESIFQKAAKLHLTICVFVLLDDSEKAEAIKALQEYRDTILSETIKDKEYVKVKVCGIDSMNGNHRKVDVLYAKAKLIDETDDYNLQSIANGISDYFYERGFAIQHKDNVKLHMTLMNTKHRKEPNSPKRWVKRQSFDATKIFEKYQDYYFGTSNLETIRLSLMSSEGEDGFYKCLSTITVAKENNLQK